MDRGRGRGGKRGGGPRGGGGGGRGGGGRRQQQHQQQQQPQSTQQTGQAQARPADTHTQQQRRPAASQIAHAAGAGTTAVALPLSGQKRRKDSGKQQQQPPRGRTFEQLAASSAAAAAGAAADAGSEVFEFEPEAAEKSTHKHQASSNPSADGAMGTFRRQPGEMTSSSAGSTTVQPKPQAAPQIVLGFGSAKPAAVVSSGFGNGSAVDLGWRPTSPLEAVAADIEMQGTSITSGHVYGENGCSGGAGPAAASTAAVDELDAPPRQAPTVGFVSTADDGSTRYDHGQGVGSRDVASIARDHFELTSRRGSRKVRKVAAGGGVSESKGDDTDDHDAGGDRSEDEEEGELEAMDGEAGLDVNAEGSAKAADRSGGVVEQVEAAEAGIATAFEGRGKPGPDQATSSATAAPISLQTVSNAPSAQPTIIITSGSPVGSSAASIAGQGIASAPQPQASSLGPEEPPPDSNELSNQAMSPPVEAVPAAVDAAIPEQQQEEQEEEAVNPFAPFMAQASQHVRVAAALSQSRPAPTPVASDTSSSSVWGPTFGLSTGAAMSSSSPPAAVGSRAPAAYASTSAGSLFGAAMGLGAFGLPITSTTATSAAAFSSSAHGNVSEVPAPLLNPWYLSGGMPSFARTMGSSSTSAGSSSSASRPTPSFGFQQPQQQHDFPFSTFASALGLPSSSSATVPDLLHHLTTLVAAEKTTSTSYTDVLVQQLARGMMTPPGPQQLQGHN